MLTRRSLLAASLFAAATPAFAQAPTAGVPGAILTAIYTRAAKGKGDGGAAFVTENKAAKARYLSKALVALWAKANAHTPKGYVGPIDFDPVTNSQEPDVKSFKIDEEKMEADKATLAVTSPATTTTANPPTRSCVTISCAKPTVGRSTTSRAPPTARPGRSARYWRTR